MHVLCIVEWKYDFERQTAKGMEGNCRCLLKYCPSILLERLKWTATNLRIAVFRTKSPEHSAGVLSLNRDIRWNLDEVQEIPSK